MASQLNISNNKISLDYSHPIQVISMEFTGGAEFEVIPEDCVAIYKNNNLIVIFDNEILPSELFNYKGNIVIKNFKVLSKDRLESIEDKNITTDLWKSKYHNWEDENKEYENLDQYINNDYTRYKSIVKFKRGGKLFIDNKSINKSNLTSINNNHKHSYLLDSEGNGYTSIMNGHRHKVVNYVVQRAKKHIHKIKNKGRIRNGIK
tara:strand:- start:1720 stop:2334 length:615 start_codon:yes stop_codon:yes gene_type:complete